MARIMVFIFAVVVAAWLSRRGVESQTTTSSNQTLTTESQTATSSNQTPTTATVNTTLMLQPSSSVLASNSSSESGTDNLSTTLDKTTTAVQLTTSVQPSPTEAAAPTSTVSPPTSPSTSGPTEKMAVWDKAIDLATPLGTFIIVIVAVALLLILLIAFILVSCKYRNLKKRTKFPSQVTINDADHRWIQSSEDLMMWERNLRASEVASNGRSLSDRPYNEKRK